MSDERFTAPLCIPMMAPAMNTRTDEHFRYRELARQKARVERSIGLERLPRLMDLVGSGNGPATAILVSLTFHLDGEGDVWAVGEVTGSLRLLCQGCAEILEYPLCLPIELCLVDSDRRAAELKDREVMVVEGDELSLPDLIEDELLLGMPERLCVDVPCERAPVLHYPAAESGHVPAPGSSRDELGADRQRPFESLEDLRRRLKSSSVQTRSAERGEDDEPPSDR